MDIEGLQELDWTRLAMAVDCEGSIYVSKQSGKSRQYRTRYFIRVIVYNTNFHLIDWLQFMFELKVSFVPSKNPKHKDYWHAYADSWQAYEIIKNIRPWLVIKGELAQLALSMQETLIYSGRGRAKVIPKEVLDYREELCNRARSLNQRGQIR